MISLDGRVALVTGGGRGIGRSISFMLANAGANVAVNYRQDREAAEQTVSEIVSEGGHAKVYQASVDENEDCEKLVREVVDDFGDPSILVSNAGIASRGLSVAETSPDEVQQLVATHALAAHSLCRLLIPKMRETPRADIVMISSAVTKDPIANGGPYNMAKAALEALAYTISKEEREHGIRANVVAPGLVDTEMGRRLMRARAGILDMRELDDISPFGHVCQPDEIAKLVLFLVSAENTYMTGERIGYNAGGTVDHDWY